MNRDEAYQAMLDGHRIRHQNFTSSEYFFIRNGCIISEDGYDFSKLFYSRDLYKDGWLIKNEK